MPPKGKAGRTAKAWRIEMFERRRLRGKPTLMGVRRFATRAHEALQAAKHAASIALDRETLALALVKDLVDALRAARQEAAVAVEQKKEADAR